MEQSGVLFKSTRRGRVTVTCRNDVSSLITPTHVEGKSMDFSQLPQKFKGTEFCLSCHFSFPQIPLHFFPPPPSSNQRSMMACVKRRQRTSSSAVVGWILLSSNVNAFIPSKSRLRILPSKSSALLMSSRGDEGNDNPLNRWIRGEDREDSEDYSEHRLPASYGAIFDDEDDDDTASEMGKFGPLPALARSTGDNKPGKINPYLKVVSRLTPSDLISKFTATASPRVQDAVRTTILGLIGGLPQMAFETKTVATGERLASLMFQLQMTGYMFKNAEYRISLSESLQSQSLLPSDSKKAWRNGVAGVKGTIKVRFESPEEPVEDETANATAAATATLDREVSDLKVPGVEVEVDAASYMTELRTEVARLRNELEKKKQAREEEVRKDLLMYIRTLPPKELKELTSTMSPEVLDAMKGLVSAVLSGISDEDGDGEMISPTTVTEQSGESLAELCMWQLVVGFNLRELEVREQVKKSFKNTLGDGAIKDSDNDYGPGAFE